MNGNMIDDVIVIGGGPSGSLAAMKIAEAGFSVQIIERKKKIGYPLQCGEAITEFCLQNVGLKENEIWIKNRVKGIKIVLPNKKKFFSSQPWLNINRPLFDKWLIEGAENNGAKLQIDTFMKNIEGHEGKWTIQTNNGSYKAKIIIAADGPLSQTARMLDLLKKREYIKAIQYKFDAKDVPDSNNDKWLSMYMDAALKGGYAWVFPRGDEYNIGIGGPFADKIYLQKFCISLGINPEKRKATNGGLLPYNFEFEQRTKNGCIIIGDAAGMTNPATGAGIHAGLASGKMAAEIAIEALRFEKFEILEKYDKKIRRTPFLDPAHFKAAQYFRNWTNDDWKFFGDAADGLEMDDLTLYKSFLISIKYPDYIMRAKELLTIRKAMKINKKYS